MPASSNPRPDSPAAPLRIVLRRDLEAAVQREVMRERRRLEQVVAARHTPVAHFHRPVERPFTAAERDRVTILIGGLTRRHDALLQAAFQAAGYRVDALPVPDVSAFQLGKEYGNNGQCNPTYFMVGALIQFLRDLEARGLTRCDIIDRYVFFTAGSCGPCRFGMYEAEYRLALQNAGFEGFRVLLFQQSDGVKAVSGEPGLKFTVDFGMSVLMAMNVADVLNDLACQIRPFEATPGQTDRVLQDAVTGLMARVRTREPFELRDHLPAWLTDGRRLKPVTDVSTTLGKIYLHLYGGETLGMLGDLRDRLGQIEVDRLRVKPVVKVTGEFWAQTTEGDGNFRMFDFLEQQGAQVMVEPIATWIMYMLWLAQAKFEWRKGVYTPKRPGWALHQRLGDELRFQLKRSLFALGRVFYTCQYRRIVRQLGGAAHPLVSLDELSRLAAPYYHVFAMGGEGHMEVAKNIYYTVTKQCHMVLSLKPFGCMPSTQSDGVQSAVMNHFKDMIFLPVETSGEGDVHAHSRVQMALGEARAKARTEFEQALASTGRPLEAIRRYVAGHPVLRHPLYHVPTRPGIAGTAANFVLHVSELMETE